MRGLQIPENMIPDRLKREIELNAEYFQNFKSQHRHHQIGALESLVGCQMGQISIPTGTGKTRIQADLHVSKMFEMNAIGERAVLAIASHRLLLNKQILDEVTKVAAESNCNFNLLYVGSSKADENEYNDLYRQHKGSIKVLYSLNPADIEKFYKKTKQANRHLFVVSTLNSINLLSALPHIDIMTIDEAHILEGETSDFKNDFSSIRDSVKEVFFFTATRRTRGEEGGMNDFDFYGPIKYTMSPRQAIDAMEIVRPHIHLVKLVDEEKENIDKSQNASMIAMSIVTGFSEHESSVAAVSADPSKIGAKLMVCMEFSTHQMMVVYQNIQDYCRKNSIRSFVFGSKDGGSYYVDGKKVSRNVIMEHMREIKDTDKAIMLHINILSEGIDIPSITGVMLFREMDDAKMIQSLGRGARLLKYDRERFYRGEITTDEVGKFLRGEKHSLVKPCFFVLIPTFYESLHSAEDVKRKIRKVYSEYELSAVEFQAVERGLSHVVSDMDTLTYSPKDLIGPTSDLEHIIFSIADSKEVEEFKRQTGHITTSKEYLEAIKTFIEGEDA